MKRFMGIANGAFAAAFLLAPMAIFACPAGGNNGIVTVDSHPAGDVKAADHPLTSDCDNTFVHMFNVVDQVGTYSIVDGDKVLATGAWKGEKAATGNGFDATAGPVKLPAGQHTVKVFDTSGLSAAESSKAMTCEVTTPPAPVPSSNPGNGSGNGGLKGPGKTGPGDNNRGDTWLQTVGPCPDKNAEQLNHNPNAFGNCNIANTAGADAVQPPFEPVAEAAQNAEIGTTEDTNPNHTPHLPCANIEVMGKGMGDASGAYSVDVWPPTGNMTPVYGKDVSGASVLTGQMTPGDVGNNGTWTFDAAKHAYQVMDIIDVDALVHNADVAGGHEHPIQGYHFKLQFGQDPQKHKTFWVDCPSPSQPPVVTPPPGPCQTIAQSLQAYSFSVNGGPAVQDLENNVHQGDHVVVTYTTTGECSTQAFSLVSYTAPTAEFSTSNANQQKVYKFDTATTGSGTHTLAVDVPGCFFQVDFVKGAPIFDLGANPNEYYSAQGRLVDAENGGTQDCSGVTPPPPAPILGIVKHVDKTQVVAPAPLTYTIDVTNSGNGAATNVGVWDILTPGTVQVDGPSNFTASAGSVAVSDGKYIWTIPSIAPGATAELTFTLVAKTAGTITNAGSIGVPGTTCEAPTCSQVQTVVTTPPAPGTITAVIYREGTTQVVSGGTVQLLGVTTPSSAYPKTYGNLPAASYCVQEVNPSAWNLTGATVSGIAATMASPGQVCFPLAGGQTVPVVYYVTRSTQHPTACVAEEYMLQGTTIVVPGGTGKVDRGADSAAETTPFTFCNLPTGSITGTAVTPPAGYTLVSSSSPQTVSLHAGNNAPIIFLVNLPQPQPQCGEVLGTIVLHGTHTVVPGGTITQGGQPAVTTYPALLGPCQPAGQVPVSATAPSGYTIVGPTSTSVSIVNGAVTPVIFQVAPISGGGQGAGNPPGGGNQGAGGVQAASVQHAPVSGVLGTSIGMPLTGSEVAVRVGLSILCLALGLFTLRFTVRRRQI